MPHGIVGLQGVKGVPSIEEGLNPATWMLEVSSLGSESRLGINFADVYKDSKFAKCVTLESRSWGAAERPCSWQCFLLNVAPPPPS